MPDPWEVFSAPADDAGPWVQFQKPADPEFEKAVASRMGQLRGTVGASGLGNIAQKAFTLGLKDEVEAAAAGTASWLRGSGFQRGYDVEKEAMKRLEAQDYEESPIAANAVNIGGALATAPMAAGAKLAQVGSRGAAALSGAMQAAKAGAVTGGITGAAEGEGLEGRLGSGLMGATIGGIGGGILGAGVGAIAHRNAPTAIPEVVAASERLGVPVPVAMASDSMAVQRAGQFARNAPFVGNAIPQATQETLEGLQGAVGRVADDFGQGTGPNVANRIGRRLQDAAEAETGRARQALEATDEARAAAFEGARGRAVGAVGQREEQAGAAVDAAVGRMSDQDMGTALIARLRTGEREARARKDALYRAAEQSGGVLQAGGVQNVRTRVAQGLEDAGVIVDDMLTPAASRMFGELTALGNLRIQNLATGRRLPSGGDETIAGVSMQGVEQVRKRLNALRQAAANDADRRATRHVMRQFDDWLDDAFDNALYSGSDEALQAWRRARLANREWRQGFYGRDSDADRVITRIVTGEVTPQEVSNYLLGASRVGAKGVSSRLLTSIERATNGDAQVMGTIRAGIWSRLANTAEGVDDRTGTRVANDIHEFLNGSGRDLAERLFNAGQQDLLRAYADTMRAGVGARQAIEQFARTNRPRPGEVGVGPMRALAEAVLGRGPGKTDEALFNALDAYAKSGSRGDINTLSRIVNLMGDEKGNLAGAFVRQLGVSPRTGQWSPDYYLSQWRSYTPQAKAVLFGMSGAHRAALDDIAIVAQRFQDVGKRFGNPSGTAQNLSGAIMGVSALSNPIQTVASIAGGAVVSRMLAAPATAKTLASWSRAYEAAARRPAIGTMKSLEAASRRLSGQVASEFGVTIDPMRLLPGPRPSYAEHDQEKYGQGKN